MRPTITLTSACRSSSRAVNSSCWASRTAPISLSAVARDTSSSGKVKLLLPWRSASRRVAVAISVRRRRSRTPQVSAGCRAVELDEFGASLDEIAFLDFDRFDDAAFEMLDRLVVSGRRKAAAGDRGARKLRRCGPIAKAQNAEDEYGETQQGGQSYRRRHRSVPAVEIVGRLHRRSLLVRVLAGASSASSGSSSSPFASTWRGSFASSPQYRLARAISLDRPFFHHQDLVDELQQGRPLCHRHRGDALFLSPQ